MAVTVQETTNATPSVSVIVPCYNQARYLPEALDSVLAQTWRDWECIVVDDGSPDATAAVADGYVRRDARFRCVHRENGGLPAARNTGITAARGEFLVFLDADDLLLPRMIETLLACLRAADSAVVAAHCGWMITDETGQDSEWIQQCPFEGDLGDALRESNRFVVHAAMVRKVAIDAIGGFDETLRRMEDWDFWWRLASDGRRFLRSPQVLVKYRQRPGSIGRRTDDGIEGARLVTWKIQGGTDALADVRLSKTNALLFASQFVAEGRVDEAVGLLRAELSETEWRELDMMECGRAVWAGACGALALPPAKWAEAWARIGVNVLRFAEALTEATGGGLSAREAFLTGLEPFCTQVREIERLRKIEASTSYKLGRLVTRLKFW